MDKLFAPIHAPTSPVASTAAAQAKTAVQRPMHAWTIDAWTSPYLQKGGGGHTQPRSASPVGRTQSTALLCMNGAARVFVTTNFSNKAFVCSIRPCPSSIQKKILGCGVGAEAKVSYRGLLNIMVREITSQAHCLLDRR